MGEESDESDEKFATGIEANWVPRPPLEFFRAVVQSLYELEHGAGFRLSTSTPDILAAVHNEYVPFDMTIASAKERMAASGGDILGDQSAHWLMQSPKRSAHFCVLQKLLKSGIDVEIFFLCDLRHVTAVGFPM